MDRAPFFDGMGWLPVDTCLAPSGSAGADGQPSGKNASLRKKEDPDEKYASISQAPPDKEAPFTVEEPKALDGNGGKASKKRNVSKLKDASNDKSPPATPKMVRYTCVDVNPAPAGSADQKKERNARIIRKGVKKEPKTARSSCNGQPVPPWVFFGPTPGNWDDTAMVPWWTKKLMAVTNLKAQSFSGIITVDRMSEITGDSQIVHVCGTPRALFDLRFDLGLTIKFPMSSRAYQAQIKLTAFSSDVAHKCLLQTPYHDFPAEVITSSNAKNEQ